MDLGLMGRSVLITGGSGGIGLATAHAFAAEGCALHLAARTADKLWAARKGISRDFDVPVAVHAVDLSRGENARRLAETCADVDILVNNAGAIPGGKIEEIDDDRWREAWDLKVFGYVNMMRALYAEMGARGRGVIVNVIGTAGDQRPADYAAGLSANSALATLTRALGGESLDHGVRVVGVSPGDMTNERGMEFMRRQAEKEFGDPGRWRERLSRLPGGRAATSEDVADAIVFLASPRAGYVSGTVLTVDGGLSSRRAVT
ncbi:MAG TPA: short-chain dehydrogenase/reductase [Rubrobacter sp.]|nr:short-chain dehydrogenase/reductase [Rubrobacter sp.]